MRPPQKYGKDLKIQKYVGKYRGDHSRLVEEWAIVYPSGLVHVKFRVYRDGDRYSIYRMLDWVPWSERKKMFEGSRRQVKNMMGVIRNLPENMVKGERSDYTKLASVRR